METTNTSAHSSNSLKNGTWFQTTVGNIYTLFQTETAKTEKKFSLVLFLHGNSRFSASPKLNLNWFCRILTQSGFCGIMFETSSALCEIMNNSVRWMTIYIINSHKRKTTTNKNERNIWYITFLYTYWEILTIKLCRKFSYAN